MGWSKVSNWEVKITFREPKFKVYVASLEAVIFLSAEGTETQLSDLSQKDSLQAVQRETPSRVMMARAQARLLSAFRLL